MKFKFRSILITLLTVFVIGSLGNVTRIDAADETFSLSIHKYYMDDASLAGTQGTGEETTTIPTDASPLKNIPFDVYKINSIGGVYPNGGSYTIVEREGSLILIDQNNNNAEFALDASVTNVVTDDTGLAKADLDKGYYVAVERQTTNATVVENGSNKEVSVNPVEPFVVQLPMTNPDGNGFINDVHVYPKNEGIAFEKEVSSDASVNVGDVVSYRISGKVPAGTIESKSFIIHDVLDSALDLELNSIKVYGIDATNKETEIASSLYTVSANFTLTFTDAGRVAIASYKSYSVEFDTVVNKNIIGRQDNTVNNTAKIEFVNKNGDTVEKDTPNVGITTGSIVISKKSGLLGSNLANAKFQIASSLENAKAGKYIKLGSNNEIIDASDADYLSAAVWEVTTDANGSAKFEGLKESNQGALISYWLVETQAPDGFYLLDEPVQVTFVEDQHTLNVTIKNTQKGFLPKTGSRESIAMSVSGVALIGIGIFVLLTRKESEQA